MIRRVHSGVTTIIKQSKQGVQLLLAKANSGWGIHRGLGGGGLVSGLTGKRPLWGHCCGKIQGCEMCNCIHPTKTPQKQKKTSSTMVHSVLCACAILFYCLSARHLEEGGSIVPESVS